MTTIQAFQPTLYSGQERSKLRSVVVLLAVASMGYVAGALIPGLLPSPNEPVALARSAPAAETSWGNAFSADASVPAVRNADQLRQFDINRVEDPRECDVLNGISTACIFMD